MIKLVKDTIVTAVSDIVIGLITESVSDGKMTIKENIKFWSFKKKIKKWLREFIKKNDGTILTSGKFEDFLKYYKLIEKIYEHLLQSNGDITTKEELINGLVGQLKVFFNDDEREINEYKEVYAQNMMRVCHDIIREEYEVLNPVWRNYFSLCVKYKCGLETK